MSLSLGSLVKAEAEEKALRNIEEQSSCNTLRQLFAEPTAKEKMGQWLDDAKEDSLHPELEQPVQPAQELQQPAQQPVPPAQELKQPAQQWAQPVHELQAVQLARQPAQSAQKPQQPVQQPVQPVHEPQAVQSTPSEQPTQTSSDSSVTLNLQHKMIDAMQLPKCELQKFDGDPLQYWVLIRSFDATVGNTSVDDSVKLNRLFHYCIGDALAVIRSCVVMEPKAGYMKARELLRDRFGNDYKISEAWVQKLTEGPVLPLATERQSKSWLTN